MLNKTDLVSDESELNGLHRRIREINALAEIQRATKAKVPLDFKLGIGGFDLEKVQEAHQKMNNTVTAIRTMTMNTITVTPTMLWSNPARLSATTPSAHTLAFRPAPILTSPHQRPLGESGEVICNDPTCTLTVTHTRTTTMPSVLFLSSWMETSIWIKLMTGSAFFFSPMGKFFFRMKGVLSIEGCDDRISSRRPRVV